MHCDKFLLSVALMGCLVTSGCTVKPPSNDGRETIEKVLRDSIRSNDNLAKSGKLRPSIERALTPELDVYLGKPHGHISNAPRFDVAVTNVPARDFFAGLVKDTKYNIVVDPEIKGFVTLNLRQVTVPQVMEAVRDGYGYEFEETDYGFKIYPSRLETKVFKLNYIDVSRRGSSYTTLSAGQQVSSVGNGNKSGLSSSGSAGSRDTLLSTGGSINTENDGKFWEVLKQNLDALISSSKDNGSVVVVNPKAGTVIARAYPSELRAIARYINKVQAVIQRQVIIEAKIIEVELNAQFHSGIDWKLFGIHQTKADGDVWAFNSAMNIKATSGNAFQAAIDLLNYQGNVNVLSSPRVATLNNQKAVIKVGSDRFFVTDVGSDVSTGGGASVTTSSMTLTPFFSGISLDVTPQIDEDENVTIHIHPIISTVSDDNRSFTVNSQQQSLPMARSEVRESDTVVRAKNGQVIVIGGLMKSESRLYNSSTPGLDRVPVLNGAFKSVARSSGKCELVILLRPIIASNTNWQKQLKDTAININRMEPDGEYRYEMQYSKDITKAR